ncbi:polycystic kidney disease protein 1-like 2 [Betta splendens]|uniref:Polycystic kidney disease protein 1-like 2 n=1 Tax=Betta splendens TaxID=158456 RepID=A0A6P7LY40_BETSP|nr:polycystic kidney disease protein 1-like 2 [Betta splendens]
MLPWTSVLLWTLAGFLSLPDKSEPCRGNGLSMACDFIFRNVCFEFVDDSKPWSQARDSCESRGGKLLEAMSSPVKNLMKNITRGNKNIIVTWWLGEEVQVDSVLLNRVASNNSCMYVTLKPLLLILTSDCSQSRGSVCTHSLQSSSQNPVMMSSHEARPRLRRNIQGMASSIANITALLQSADDELHLIETNPGEPTNNDRDQFIQYLLAGTKTLTPSFAVQNTNVMSHIINCSTGIFLLSEKKCDIATNPNPTDLFERIFEIFRLVAILIGTANNQTLVMKLRTGTLYQRTYSPADLGHAVLGSQADGDYVVFPSYSALQAQLGVSGPIFAQMASLSDNPHPSDDNITGTVCSLLLTNGVSDITLWNLSDMIEIFLPRPDAPDVVNTTVLLTTSTKALTSFNVSDPSMTLFFSAEPSVNVTLVVALSYGSPPSSKTPNITAVLTVRDSYRWMVTPEMLQHTTGLWYIDTRLSNSSSQSDLSLKITSFMTKCLYWNMSTETWRTDGCWVGNKSTSRRTHCLCNHLTLFGSSFFVMPNYVDISQTAQLFATVSQNYVVLALLCSFFGLYLITLMWACYADHRSRLKRKITLVESNHPGALYNYLIHVQTGHRRNAGTTANVTVTLIGSEGESDAHVLTDPEKPVFEKGAVDMFLLSTAFPLGEVSNLRMQHDNSGGHPSWYVNKVIVQDLQTRHAWHFFCNCWLSADRGDNMTKKTFNAAKSNEIASFRNIFQSRTSTGFRDEHIWVSIVNPPSRSPFTRAQRVSCCMSLLLCTMAINIAFWNVPLDPNAPVIFQIGSLQITWQEFMVGVECGLLMFPINILIITIFRSIRARVVSKPQEDENVTLRAAGINVPAILKETEVIIYTVSSSPRNKLSEISKLESSSDLYYALDRLHEFVQLMQGESESDQHWVYCSKFLLAGLCHLLMCLEKLDERNFPHPQEYQQVLNITNLLVRKTEMVFSSHLACCPTPVKRTKRKMTGGFWLPWWFAFVGWFLLLSISGVSTYFTLLYSFQYGKDKSIKWVLSLGLSLFQSIFVLQPLKVLGVAVVFALLLKPVAVEETEEVEQVLLEQQAKCRRYSGRETL